MEIPEKNKVPIDLIARFLNGEADTDDIIDLEQWKAASGENFKVFEEYRRIWEKTGQLSLFADIDIEEEWNVFLENTASRAKEHYPSRGSEKGRLIQLRPLIRIAAAILAGLVLGYSVWFALQSIKYEKVVAGNELIEINLPDGSNVTLNKNTRIVYPRKFSANRSLKLDGEAFFIVREDKDHPFIIKSGSILVEVVGTSFNVVARKDENLVQVMVASGSVAVYNEEFQPLTKDILQKGEKINYSRESGIRAIQPITDPNYDAWKTGRLVFDNSSLQYITALLEKMYGIDIELINPLLNECRISVSFEKESPDFILRTITETLDLELIKTEKGYTINGSGC